MNTEISEDQQMSIAGGKRLKNSGAFRPFFLLAKLTQTLTPLNKKGQLIVFKQECFANFKEPSVSMPTATLFRERVQTFNLLWC